MHRDNLMDISLNGTYQREKTKDKKSHAKVPIEICWNIGTYPERPQIQHIYDDDLAYVLISSVSFLFFLSSTLWYILRLFSLIFSVQRNVHEIVPMHFNFVHRDSISFIVPFDTYTSYDDCFNFNFPHCYLMEHSVWCISNGHFLRL